MKLLLKAIQRDTSIQTRADINLETVNLYADAMTDGAKFPPVVLFGTTEKCWIGDGWHRIMAADQIGALDIDADLRSGGREDALWYAMGANRAHGLPMGRGDVKRAVELAVRTWPDKSQQEIAKQVGCGQQYVSRIKEDITPSGIIPPTRTDSMGRERPTAYNRTATSATFNPVPDDFEDEEEQHKPQRKEKEEKKQHKGSTKDAIRLREIVEDIKSMLDELAGLNLPNSERPFAVAALDRIGTRIAAIKKTTGEMK